jgi:predicted transcriptional regulator
MRRDKLEIIRNVLMICKRDNATKTKIVYKANLNFKTAGYYLEWLIAHELVTKNDGHFKLTQRGDKLLSSLQGISPLLDVKESY